MRLIDFADGFTSSTQPTVAALGNVSLDVFADDAAYEADRGRAAQDGDIYINSTTNFIRYYVNGAWHNSGGVAYQEVLAGTSNGVNTTFGPLTQQYANEDSILIFLDSLVVPSSEWSLVGNSIVFGAGSIPQFGQTVYAFYLSSGASNITPAPTGTFNVEYRTLTAGEATAESLALASTPADASKVIVDAIGGAAQHFGVDFTVAGNSLSWNGLGLDGILEAGDVLRIQYIT